MRDDIRVCNPRSTLNVVEEAATVAAARAGLVACEPGGGRMRWVAP